jgi:hypothetical protein
VWQKLNIEVIPGDSKNVNKNPVAERAVREVEDEILKIQTSEREITPSILAQATMAVNNKIRYTGFSANELLTNTNSLTGEKLQLDDKKLSDMQYENRQKVHDSSAKYKATSRGSKNINPIVKKGDLVMVKSDKSKFEARKQYVVVEVDEENRAVIVQKFVDNQIRAKKYKVKIEQIILVEKSKTEMFNSFPTAEALKHDNLESQVAVNIHNEVEDIQNFPGTFSEAEEPIRRTREKPRIDYSEFNESGRKTLKVQSTKIDFNSQCSYCFTRKYSNFYHSEKICIRKKKSTDKIVENDDDENTFFVVPATSEEVVNLPKDVVTNAQIEEEIEDDTNHGLENLKRQLIRRGINFEICAPEVLAMVHDYINYHTIGAKIEMSVVKIQTWWRRILGEKTNSGWDHSQDPPNWGKESSHPVSLEVDSDDNIERVFEEIDLERQKQRLDALEDIIYELDVSGGAQSNYLNLSDPSFELFMTNPEDDVFEIDMNNVTVVFNPERESRTTSVSVNVFGNEQSRSNSVEHFVPMSESRHFSLDETEFRRMTRSRSALKRVPLETTPLKNTVKDDLTPPGPPS